MIAWNWVRVRSSVYLPTSAWSYLPTKGMQTSDGDMHSAVDEPLGMSVDKSTAVSEVTGMETSEVEVEMIPG